MIRTRKTVVSSIEETIEAMVCNKCGREVTDRYLFAEINSFTASGGWASVYPSDMATISFDICGECLFEFVRTFKLPPFDSLDSLGDRESAIHTESGEVVEFRDLDDLIIRDRHLHPRVDSGPHPNTGQWEDSSGAIVEVLRTLWDPERGEWLVAYKYLDHPHGSISVTPLTKWNESDKGGKPNFLSKN
jgi:hypothetical protein